MAQNHTVTQSTFAEPCVAMEGGVDSGFIPNPNNTVNPPPTMEFQVMTEKPIWMYCAQGNHCGAGMVFSINPTEEKSHAAFLENALKNGDDAGGAAGGAGAGGLGDAAGNAAVSATGTCTTETMTAAAETQAAGWAQTTAAAWPAESSASTDSAWAQSSTSQAAPAAQTSGVVQGTGTWTSGGACDCSCLCGAGAFPDGAGIGAVGGMEGTCH
ncbi:hypothetical protein VTN31DRAFT_819 [Thermomyces dupontii]|uniref:uncharacterized protein n=1 Tax=Talaromyces thermophilus TaxID=28565 RepID=UPI003742BFD2